jgi:drug/metabolite transporter (DMT)-like permease
MNLWLPITLLATLLTTLERVLHRYILRAENDANIYTLVYQFAAALVLVPLVVGEPQLKSVFFHDLRLYLVWLISSLFWLAFGLFSFHADHYADVSVTSILSRTRILWTFVLGVFFFGEAISFAKLQGVALIFAGLVGLSIRENFKYNKGVLFTLMAAISISIALSIDKYLARFFPTSVIAFSAFFIPGIWLYITLPNKRERLKKLFSDKGKYAILTALFGALSYWLLLRALTLSDISKVIPIYQSSLALNVIIGIILLNEREKVLHKLFASAIVLLGVILIRLS